MISQLRGKMLEKQPPHLLLDVNGVGYALACPMSTFYTLEDTNHSITLHTHLVIRDDSWQLYGFATRDERRWFRMLIKINGVGPKLALTILSGMELNEFISCISIGDHQRLVAIPGIGKKTAERITIEARDAISTWQQHSNKLLPKTTNSAAGDSMSQKLFETQRALLALGYKESETTRMLAQVKAEIAQQTEQPEPKLEILIRMALQQTATHR